MKVAIYSPYLDTLGGGERYIATIAEVLSTDFAVDLLLDENLQSMSDIRLKENLEKRFNLDLSKVRLIAAPLGHGSNSLNRLFFLDKYDFLFYLTDGSIFYPTAKRNILHIQSPLIGEATKSLWGKLKLNGWDLIIYNSQFTKEAAQNYWPLESKVIYPPVDTDKIKPKMKKKYILSVGRFFSFLKSKKHELLIKTFEKIWKNGKITEWSLHLVGSAAAADLLYLNQLKNLTKDLPVNFYPNLDYEKLVKLYGEASIYWHAAGFGESDPTKMEHFGIATVEAMSGGCVPVVIKKGGQMEIVQNGRNGFLWDSQKELEEKTELLINDNRLWIKLSKQARKVSQKFSKTRFETEIMRLIKET